MQTVTVKLKAKDYKVLMEESRKLGISVEEFLAYLAEEYIQRATSKESEQDFMSLVNLGRSGESDISVNHDRYLGEAVAREHNIR
ncbi:MAG: hypothetical protein DRP99_02465 [Candidatus Latescibacterota bacterium]|nr:MAG: hypothetical protein DRP99_02465 [Candidatus Latescibacterota bacterium]